MRLVGEAGITLFDERELVQGGVDLEGRSPRRLVVEEHDDELGRVRELSPVRLLAEPPDVVAYLPGMVGQPGPADVVVRSVLVRLEVPDERDLRVDHDRLAAGKAHDDVRPKSPTLVSFDGGLLVEVAVRQHPGHLDHASELDLAPATARVRLPAQGVDEIPRLRPQALVGLPNDLELLVNLAVRALPLLLEQPDVRLDLLERLAQAARRTRPGDPSPPR